MPRIIDNIKPPFLDEVLAKTLEESYRLDTSVGYFNLRGWGNLWKQVDAMPARDGEPAVRLLIGMADRPEAELREVYRISGRKDGIDNAQAAEVKAKLVAGLKEQLTYGYPTKAAEEALRALRHQLIEGKVEVKAFLRHRLHAKLYLCHRDDYSNPRTGFVGSSNLTFAGLSHQGELNVDVLDQPATERLHEWFEDRWDDNFSVDISAELAEILDESWASERLLDPYLVYLKLAYHLSQEAREGLLEYGVPENMPRDLLKFQTAAVQVAARIVVHRGGVMIGDVVGLGKTIVATALARLLQEELGTETLIIAPKNLVSMWEGYVHKYRLLAKVESLSMVDKRLAEMRRYRVVIIDESHNLRNRDGVRYKAIHEYLERNDSKVILLTATPYNKRYLDVANQLGLFLPADTSVGIRPDKAISKLGETEFLAKCDGKPQAFGAFRHSEEPEDWRRLMSLYLVRRTRRFIQDNYAQTDETGQAFLEFADGSKFYLPERRPRVIDHKLSDDEPAAKMISDTTLDAVGELLLPRYKLATYAKEDISPTDVEASILGDLERSATNLIGITRVSLYKRLSSSGAAFLISLKRHLLRNWVYVNALEAGDLLPVGHVEDTIWDDDLDPEQETLIVEEGDLSFDRSSDDWSAIAASAYRVLAAKKSRAIRWIRSELFGDQLKDDLRHDIEILQGLLAEFGTWRQEGDSKLDALEDLLVRRYPDDKVLIFTEYKDTAEYVAQALKARGVESIEAVSGETDDPTKLARRFSPNSNRAIGGLPEGTDELRILVSTDVLSEGQNLQDAHIIVNYDLPWAIIKIIQRAGRVDRIGQQAPEVFVYSFRPSDGVEAIIRLRQRIVRRLKENAIVFGSDEEFFGEEGERRFITGLYDESRTLDDYDGGEGDVDWASLAYEIWRKASEEHPDLAAKVEQLPNVVYATRPARTKQEQAGVVVHVRTEHGYDAMAFTSLDGESELLSPYEALTLAACESDTEALPPMDEHHDLVAQAVTGPLQSPAAHLAGALTGVRKRCWDRLTGYKQRYTDTLFDTESLDAALDELYRKPLLDSAINTLSKALRERTPEELADLIVLLHNEGKLCVADDDLADDDIRLVSSMGIRK